MTQEELTSAIASGNAEQAEPQSTAPPAAAPQSSAPSSPDSSASSHDLTQYIPLLTLLQSTQRALSAPPTGIPQTFQDQIQFVFDGTATWLYFYANNQWNKIIALANTASLQQVFTAHGTITKGQALIVGTGTTGYQTVSQAGVANTENFNISTRNYIGQVITADPRTTAIRSATLALQSNVSSNITWTLSVYACVGSLPVGSAIGSTNLVTTTTVNGDFTFEFASGGVPVTPGGQYALVLSNTAPNNTNTHSQNVLLSGGQVVYSTSGTTWTNDNTRTLRIVAYEIMTTSGRVQSSDTTQTPYASDPNDLANNFVGFAMQNVSDGQPILVNLGPVDPNQSGLSTGIEYYLKGTNGVIATTPGAVSRKIGVALSSTSILIRQDNP